MTRIAWLLGMIGLAAGIGLVIRSGVGEVVQALRQAGLGIVWTSLVHLLPLAIAALGWQALAPGHGAGRRGPGFFLHILWIRAAVNALLPAARIGGELVAIRIMVARGMRRASAVAITVAETTLSALAQLVFVALGIGLLALRGGDAGLARHAALGVLLALPAIGALVAAQRLGAFGVVARMAGAVASRVGRSTGEGQWAAFAGGATRFDRALRVVYRRRGRAALCGALQFAAWAAASLEVWVALAFLGHPLPLSDCLIIEAIVQAAGSAGFAVPGALGVQEAAFLLVGGALGLAPETAAALALMRRCRDFLIYLPALVVWQVAEGRRLIAAPGRR